MTGLVLLTVLLGAPAQADASRVDVRSQHQIVTVDGKAWRWVRPGVPMTLDVKRDGSQRLALELMRVGVPADAPSKEVVRVRVGKREKRFTLRSALKPKRALPGNTDLRLSYPVRHRLKLGRKATTVTVTAPKAAGWGVLVRATLSGAKAVRDDGGLALAPLGAPPAADKPAPKKRARRMRSRRRSATKPKTTTKEPAAPSAPAAPSSAVGESPSAATAPTTADKPPAEAAAPTPTEAPAPARASDAPPASSTTAQAPASTAPTPSEASRSTAREGRGQAPAAQAPPGEAPPPEAPSSTPVVEHRPERPVVEAPPPPPAEPPSVEHRPEQPPPPPPDAPTASVEVIELIPEEPGTLLGPRKLGTGVPLLVELQLSPPVSGQALGGLGNLAFGPGARLLFGVNLGFFSRFTYGVGFDVDYQSATTDALPVARVRWQVAQVRARLEGAFDVIRLDIADVGTLHAGVLGGVGAVVGAHWVASGLDVATYPLIGPTARLGLTGGFTVGPGAVTVSVPVDWSFGAGAVTGYAPLAATFFVGYRLEL